MFKIYGGATEFKQWELDQMVTNPCMKAGDEVVFRNASGETYVTKVFEQNGEVVADVPNYLLQKALNILVDLEQGADKHDDCRTTFSVVAQDKPDGYECKHNLPDRPVKTAGGVSSWNDLADKPFYKKQVLCEIFNGDIEMVAMEVVDIWRCIGHANITPMESEPNELIITVNGNTITLPRNEYGYGSFNLDGTSVTVRVGANNDKIEFNCARSESFTISCKIEANFSSVKPIDTELLPKGHQFGCEIGEVLSECELWGMDADEDGVNDGFMLEEEVNLTVGKTYTVNYNGTEYSCVAQDISETTGGIPSIGLGNMEPVGFAGNGEPFAVMYCPEMLAMQGMDWVYGTVMVFDEAETVTISIKGEVVTPIDAEYLPAETVRRMVVKFTTEDGENVYADKDFYEIEEAYNAGFDIIGILSENNVENGVFADYRIPLVSRTRGADADGDVYAAFTFSCFVGETSATMNGFTVMVTADEIFFTRTYLNDHSV